MRSSRRITEGSDERSEEEKRSCAVSAGDRSLKPDMNMKSGAVRHRFSYSCPALFY